MTTDPLESIIQAGLIAPTVVTLLDAADMR
jgi:hypothetical protein